MATRAPFLKTRYGGYFHRHVPEEDPDITHVGSERHAANTYAAIWQPVCFSDDLKDLPIRVKIFGEDLVVSATERCRRPP